MIELNEKYKPLGLNDTRYFIVTGGRGSSKSFSVAMVAMLMSYETNHRILYSRYTMTSAKDSIIPEFQEKVELTGVTANFHTTANDSVNKKSGSSVLFRGVKTSSGDQTANLKSLTGVTTWIIEEAEDFVDEEKFNTINLSIRSKARQNRVILILNPSYKRHWIYKRFFLDAGVNEGFNGVKDNVTYIHTTYLDNLQNLSADFINEAEKLKATNYEEYEHVFLGKWRESYKGVIFPNWEIGEFDEDLPQHYGIDWGYRDPFAFTRIAVDKDKQVLYVDELAYSSGLNMEQIKQIVGSHCDQKDLIIADKAEPRSIFDLVEHGFNCTPCFKRSGIIAERVKWINEFKIIATPRSRNLHHELSTYRWADKVSETPIDKDNHAIDSFSYAFTYWKMHVAL